MQAIFRETFELTERITDILVIAGLDAKVFVPDETKDWPEMGVFITDPRDSCITWEFTPTSTVSDPSGWQYQIGTYIDDELYEGVVYEYMSHHLTPDSTAAQVADEIWNTVKLGIDPEDRKRIVEAHLSLLAEARGG